MRGTLAATLLECVSIDKALASAARQMVGPMGGYRA